MSKETSKLPDVLAYPGEIFSDLYKEIEVNGTEFSLDDRIQNLRKLINNSFKLGPCFSQEYRSIFNMTNPDKDNNTLLHCAILTKDCNAFSIAALLNCDEVDILKKNKHNQTPFSLIKNDKLLQQSYEVQKGLKKQASWYTNHALQRSLMLGVGVAVVGTIITMPCMLFCGPLVGGAVLFAAIIAAVSVGIASYFCSSYYKRAVEIESLSPQSTMQQATTIKQELPSQAV